MLCVWRLQSWLFGEAYRPMLPEDLDCILAHMNMICGITMLTYVLRKANAAWEPDAWSLVVSAVPITAMVLMNVLFFFGALAVLLTLHLQKAQNQVSAASSRPHVAPSPLLSEKHVVPLPVPAHQPHQSEGGKSPMSVEPPTLEIPKTSATSSSENRYLAQAQSHSLPATCELPPLPPPPQLPEDAQEPPQEPTDEHARERILDNLERLWQHSRESPSSGAQHRTPTSQTSALLR